MPERLIIAPETRFGRLIFLCDAEPVPRTPHRGFWRMITLRCDCGGAITTRLNSVRSGRVNSCGCLVAETSRANGQATVTHGEASGKRTPEYRTWHNMVDRCINPNFRGWKYYGGRGIKICDEWRHDYPAFLNHVGRRPSPQHSIDRYPNNDGNYEPGNVRWATKSQQAYNRRSPKR